MVTYAEVRDFLSTYLVDELNVKESLVKYDTVPFMAGLNLDSLDCLDVLMGMEAKFKVTFPKSVEKEFSSMVKDATIMDVAVFFTSSINERRSNGTGEGDTGDIQV